MSAAFACERRLHPPFLHGVGSRRTPEGCRKREIYQKRVEGRLDDRNYDIVPHPKGHDDSGRR